MTANPVSYTHLDVYKRQLLGLVPAGIWQPLAMLVLFYLLFSLLFKIKSHARRSVVTYLCFAAGTCLTAVSYTHLLDQMNTMNE